MTNNTVSIGVFIDGGYYAKIDEMLHQTSGMRLDITKLVHFIRSTVAEQCGVEKTFSQVTENHYFRGRFRATEASAKKILLAERKFEDSLIENDVERYEYLLRKLENVPEEERTAKFVSVITLIHPDGSTVVARGECPGRILREARGENGFGYDPVFFVEEDGKTMAEMSAERKNEISHRARALQALAKKLGGERYADR